MATKRDMKLEYSPSLMNGNGGNLEWQLWKWIVVFWYLSLGKFHISLYMMRWVESEIGIFLPVCPWNWGKLESFLGHFPEINSIFLYICCGSCSLEITSPLWSSLLTHPNEINRSHLLLVLVVEKLLVQLLLDKPMLSQELSVLVLTFPYESTAQKFIW